MKPLTDAQNLMVYSLYHSGECTVPQIAKHLNLKEWQVKESLWSLPEIKGVDIKQVELERGKLVQLLIPCYGTISYNDFSTIVDALFSHYFPAEKNEVVYSG